MTVSMPTDSNGVSIKVGSVSATASRPEPLDGSIDSSSNYAQYVGVSYKADGTPIYKKVGSSNRVVVTNATLSSEGVELIKRYEGFSPTLYNDKSGNSHIGYGHRIEKKEVTTVVPYDVSIHATEIVLSSTAGFKAPGEAVLSPAEVISYDSKTSTKLLGVRRGIRGTIAQFHTKGSSIVYPGEIFDNITKDKAMELFNEDIKEIVNVVRKVVKVRLNQNQFDAIVSFVRNIGEIEFKKSFFLVELNKNNIVTHEFLRYSNINEIVEKSIEGVKKQVTVKVFQVGLYNRRIDEAVLFSQPESVENMEAVKDAIPISFSTELPPVFVTRLVKNNVTGLEESVITIQDS